MTVYAGTQKITMGRDGDTDYKSKLAAAKAQAGPNSYVQGVQDALEDPFKSISEGRSRYGAPTLVPGDIASNNFSQKDSPGNQDQLDLENRSGSMLTQVSSTNVPQEDVPAMEKNAYAQQFGTSNMEERMKNMAKGGQGFPGLNNRNREV
jgi:hypothetical protein